MINIECVKTYNIGVDMCRIINEEISSLFMMLRTKNVSQRNNCNVYNFITEQKQQMNEIVGLLM